MFQIWDSDKIETIMEAFGFDAQDTLALHVNLPVVEEDCCKASFLRGAFLAGGSVTDRGRATIWNWRRLTRALPGRRIR